MEGGGDGVLSMMQCHQGGGGGGDFMATCFPRPWEV